MAFDRRGFLLGLSLCPLCAASTRAAEEAHWSYSGEGGPDHWGALDPAYRACSAGTEQSPIDLDRAVRADIARLNVDWKPQAYRVVNNGHTIQANATSGGTAILGKDSYALLQFHFHAPSEHALHGKRFAMEAHFVHARPCSETVTWIVYNRPIRVAETDIAAFKAIFPLDARPLQSLNGRYLLIGR